MINRRYPIQSVLAERKLFANGGMVSPQQPMQMQQPPMPMQMQQPMQMQPPMQPQGIMASSQPLVDAIAADALNPQGGGTLSEDDGTLSMAQGGAVGFSNGGGAFAPRVGDRTQIGLGAAPQDLRRRASMGSGELVNEMFPYEASLTGGFIGPQKLRPNIAGTEPNLETSPIEAGLLGITNFIDQAARGLSQVSSFAARSFIDIAEGLVTRRRTSSSNILSQVSAVNDALRRLPKVQGVSDEEAAQTVRDLSEAATNENPDISGDDLRQSIAQGFLNTYESGYARALADTDINIIDREVYKASTTEREDADDEEQFYNEELNTQINAYNIAIGEGPAAQQKFAQELSANPGYTQEFKDDVFGSVDVGPPRKAAVEPSVSETGGEIVADPDEDEYGTREGPFGTYMSDEDAREALVMGELRQRVDEAGDEAAKSSVPTVKTQVVETFSGKKTKEENERNMAFFMDRFKKDAPEYEGMSESEKGFALLEAGLRIMAGKSPDAITNIAEGLKGVSEEFTKDKKEKRAYDRQIELSAFKYGMEAVTKEEDRERTLDITYESTIATGSGSFVLPNGRTESYKAGQLVLVPKSIILDRGIPDNLTKPSYAGTLATANAARAKTLAAASKTLREELLVKDKQSNIIKKDFLEASDQVILGHEIKALIENSFNLSKDATGLTNVGKNLIFKALSATKWRPDFLLGPGTAAEKEERLVVKFGGREKYNNQMQEVANRLLKRLLGEGSKNVSNVDRDLAQEISGLVKGIATGALTNPTLLRERLKRILTMADNDILKGETIMRNIYGEYATRITPGMPIERIKKGGYSERVLKPLAEQSLLARRTAPRTAAQQTMFGKVSGYTFKDGKYVVNRK